MNQESFKTLEGPLKQFYDAHGVQLLGMDFPANVQLLELLYNKLIDKTFDGGEYFQAFDDQNQESMVVVAKQPLKAFNNIFLIDHALSFRYGELNEVIKPEILERLESILKYHRTKKALFKQDKPQHFTEEHDDMLISDPNSIQVNPTTIAISFFNNHIYDVAQCIQFLTKYQSIKVIWLNNNPLDQDELLNEIQSKCPWVEMLNSKFTINATDWVFKYVTYDFDIIQANQRPNHTVRYLNLSDRNVLAVKNIKSIYQWFPNLQCLDISQTEVTSLEDTNVMLAMIKQLRFLHCDIAIEDILYELRNKEISTVELINGRDVRHPHYTKATEITNKIQQIKKDIFKVANSYRLLSTDQMDESSVWYVLDELGSFVQHSDTPNVKIMPFLYLPNGKLDDQAISYSLLFPIQDLALGQPIYRDYLIGIDEKKWRSYRLAVWYDIPYEPLIEAYQKYQQNLDQIKYEGVHLEIEQVQFKTELKQENIKVITDLEMITKNVTLPYITFTNDLDQADIVYFSAGIHDDINNYLGKYINQFQHEYAIISKEKLAYTVQCTLGKVDWLQETFNLQTQLPLFMAAHKLREDDHLENTWIIKPPNMARSMDMVVTNSVEVIIRLLETGPKLAQKYIDRPLTLRNNKFDLRFIVALKSITPLQVYLYRTFWIRTSNNPYTMDVNTFTTYETHFTVMNYGRQLTQIYMDEFIQEFNVENHPYTWEQQYLRIQTTVRELFQALKQHKPEMAQCTKSRAIYGMDLMIDKDYQPKLLEMTFSPDCTRACKFTPSFFNDIFECLFFDVENANMIKLT